MIKSVESKPGEGMTLPLSRHQRLRQNLHDICVTGLWFLCWFVLFVVITECIGVAVWVFSTYGYDAVIAAPAALMALIYLALRGKS